MATLQPPVSLLVTFHMKNPEFDPTESPITIPILAPHCDHQVPSKIVNIEGHSIRGSHFAVPRLTYQQMHCNLMRRRWTTLVRHRESRHRNSRPSHDLQLFTARQMGYGTITSPSMIDWSLPENGGLLTTNLVANSPQILLSFLFLMYNGLFTCMLLVSEWAGYAHDRKPLRVTCPRKSQRSTYRLQLPYKYGVPLLLLSGILHWLVSQGLFLARVSVFTTDGVEDTATSISSIGYSNIAIITVIALGTVVVVLGILNGFRKYPAGIRLVGSCSAAISAACHRPERDTDAAEKPLMWGAVETERSIGHCCFKSFEVEKPVVGRLYAGWKSE